MVINALKSMDRTAAAALIKARANVYTYEQGSALSVVKAASIGAIGPENHYDWKKWNSVYYDHYHTADRNGAHSFYGFPQTRALVAK